MPSSRREGSRPGLTSPNRNSARASAERPPSSRERPNERCSRQPGSMGAGANLRVGTRALFIEARRFAKSTPGADFVPVSLGLRF